MTAYGRPKTTFYSLLVRKEGGSWAYAKQDGKVYETTSRDAINDAKKYARSKGYEVKVRTRTV